MTKIGVFGMKYAVFGIKNDLFVTKIVIFGIKLTNYQPDGTALKAVGKQEMIDAAGDDRCRWGGRRWIVCIPFDR